MSANGLEVTSEASNWLLFQLADSGFPTGGFAHSSGLEAATQLGEVTGAEDFQRFFDAYLWQVGFTSLPFVHAAHASPERIVDVDAFADAFLSSTVANRASRTQGRAFAATCARVFENEEVTKLDVAVRASSLRAHHTPLFGATLNALGVPCAEAQKLYLHLSRRGMASAAVRLGLFGPNEAQRIQHSRGPLLDTIMAACADLPLESVAQPSPLLELLGSAQDRLYSRLFQS